MARVQLITGDVQIDGDLAMTTVTLPDASVGNSNIATGATGSKIAAAKLVHNHFGCTEFAGDSDDSVPASAKTMTVYYAIEAFTLTEFGCKCTTNGTTGDGDFDLLVNGTTVLSAAVNQGNAETDNTVKTGTISSASVTAGDYIQIKYTPNSSHDGTGPWAYFRGTHEV